jgi:hypothetical protein
MKKTFARATEIAGVVASAAVILIVLYVGLFSINESTGKSIAGTTQTFKGTITGIACHESTYDISFSVEGQKRSYYINRGMEKGLSCEDLQKKLLNKEVEISHVAFFNKTTTGHISQLSCNGEVLYSELK